MRVLHFADLAMHRPLLPQDEQRQQWIVLGTIPPHAVPIRQLPIMVVSGRAPLCLSTGGK